MTCKNCPTPYACDQGSAYGSHCQKDETAFLAVAVFFYLVLLFLVAA